MKNTLVLFLSLLLFSSFTTKSPCQNREKDKINWMLNEWHKAAADAKYDAYFSMMTVDAIFIGTDATDNWNKADFKVWAKPFFDSGKTWDFTMLERHVYFDETGKIAWFDELLNTQMKICRGSGVLVKMGSEWKIKQYVLSMTIPNDEVNAVVKIKGTIEEELIKRILEKGSK